MHVLMWPHVNSYPKPNPYYPFCSMLKHG